MSRLRPALLVAIALLPVSYACRCDTPATTKGGGSSEGTSASGSGASWTAKTLEWDRQAFDALLSGLPEAKAEHPLEALPGDLPWLVYSDDASKWLAFAEQRELFRELSNTPLAEDLTTTGPWLQLESLRYQVARVTSFAGGTNDGDALLKGPVALGAFQLDHDRPGFVVIKRVDPEVQVVARFAAAFASLAAEEKSGGKPKDPEAEAVKPKVQTTEVEGIPVRTIERRGEKVSFALFKELLIVGTHKGLVERATALAVGEPRERLVPKHLKGKRPDKDLPASEEAEGLLPKKGTAGVHIAYRVPQSDMLRVFGLEELAVSLTHDEKAPLVLRTRGGAAPEKGSLALLKYAPGTAFFGLVDGRAPSQDLLAEMRYRVLGAGQEKKPLTVAGVDVGEKLVKRLKGGTAVFLGASDPAAEPGAPGAVIAFRHDDKAGLEPVVREVLAALTGASVERTVLEPFGGALLLTTPEDGPAAAITDDALLVALSPDRLRAAVAAGAGKAISLRDRGGVSLDGTATQAVFLDLDKGAAFLKGFYRDAYRESTAPPWSEVEPVLGPTFAALAKGGALFARLEPKDDGLSEGALRALE